MKKKSDNEYVAGDWFTVNTVTRIVPANKKEINVKAQDLGRKDWTGKIIIEVIANKKTGEVKICSRPVE